MEELECQTCDKDWDKSSESGGKELILEEELWEDTGVLGRGLALGTLTSLLSG